MKTVYALKVNGSLYGIFKSRETAQHMVYDIELTAGVGGARDCVIEEIITDLF